MSSRKLLDVEVTLSGPEGLRLKQGEVSHLGVPLDCTYQELLTRVKEWAVGDFSVDVMLFRETRRGELIDINDDRSTREALDSWYYAANRKLCVIVYESSQASSAGPAVAAAAAAADSTTTTTTTTTATTSSSGEFNLPVFNSGNSSGPYSVVGSGFTSSINNATPRSPTRPKEQKPTVSPQEPADPYSVIRGSGFGSLMNNATPRSPTRPKEQKPTPSPQKPSVPTQPRKVEPSRVVGCNGDPMKFWGALMDNCEDGLLLTDMEDAVTGLDDVTKNQMIEESLKDAAVRTAYDALCNAWITAIKNRRKQASSTRSRTAYDGAHEPALKKRSAYDGVVTDSSSSSISGSIVRRVSNSPHTLTRGVDPEQVTIKWDVKNNGEKPWDASQLELRSKGQNCFVAGFSIPDGLERSKIGLLSVTLRTKPMNNGRYDLKFEIWDKRAMATVLSGLEFTLEIREHNSMIYPSPTQKESSSHNSHADVYAGYNAGAGPAMAAADGLRSSDYAPSAPQEVPRGLPPTWESDRMTDDPVIAVVSPAPPAYNTKKSVFCAQFVQDVTLKKDGIHNKLCMGKSRVKIWRVRNTGASEWPAGCSIVPMSDSAIRVKEVSVPRAKPNEEVDVFAVIEIPSSAFSAYGDQSVTWMLIDPSHDSMLATPLNLDINVGIDMNIGIGRTDRIIETTWDHARYRT